MEKGAKCRSGEGAIRAKESEKVLRSRESCQGMMRNLIKRKAAGRWDWKAVQTWGANFSVVLNSLWPRRARCSPELEVLCSVWCSRLWIYGFFFFPTLALCPGWSSKHKVSPHPPLCLHSNPGLTSKTSSCPHHPVFLLKDSNSYWIAPSVINTWLPPSFSLIYMYVSSLQSENSLRTRITQYLVQCQVHNKN